MLGQYAKALAVELEVELPLSHTLLGQTEQAPAAELSLLTQAQAAAAKMHEANVQEIAAVTMLEFSLCENALAKAGGDIATATSSLLDEMQKRVEMQLKADALKEKREAKEAAENAVMLASKAKQAAASAAKTAADKAARAKQQIAINAEKAAREPAATRSAAVTSHNNHYNMPTRNTLSGTATPRITSGPVRRPKTAPIPNAEASASSAPPPKPPKPAILPKEPKPVAPDPGSSID